MSKVAVVYWSGTGNTMAMADAVAEGAKSAGVEVTVFGSYGWGTGEWMESWEDRCRADGAVFAADSVICQDAPGEEALEACRTLGSALA